MTTETPRLEVHVLGAGKGESIILRLPDGKWGVVDCCASSSSDRKKNATLRFLQERGVTELEFLCLTHPHDDHYRGMSHLLEAFPIHYFWRFNGLSGPHFIRLTKYLQVEAEALDETDAIESGQEFERIFALLATRKPEGRRLPLHKRSGPGTPLYPVPHDEAASFRILGLAPSGNQVERYERSFHQCFNADGTIRRWLDHPCHNMVSVALLVIFGETRILLGGDVEREGWQDVITEMGTAALASHGVKVSHHGSETGFCDGLWSHISANGKPRSVVTTYVSQSLPRRSALDHVNLNSEAVFVTCVTALRDKHLPTWIDPEAARFRLALMDKMKDMADQSRHECGRCTLIFDDRGQCIETETIPPAGRLTGGFGP